jgi:hypothetical protein
MELHWSVFDGRMARLVPMLVSNDSAARWLPLPEIALYKK